MFDAHILYYSYGNAVGDDFCIGLFGNKSFWVDIINRWAKNEQSYPGIQRKVTVEDWEELEQDTDLRGCQLAELEPDNKDYLVRWFENDEENVMRISPKTGITWETNPQEKTSVPRWVTRLKTAMKENDIS